MLCGVERVRCGEPWCYALTLGLSYTGHSTAVSCPDKCRFWASRRRTYKSDDGENGESVGAKIECC